jgi:hypothetical protein
MSEPPHVGCYGSKWARVTRPSDARFDDAGQWKSGRGLPQSKALARGL